MNTTPVATKGHNNPPSELQILEEQLTVKNIHMMRVADDWIAIANQMPENFTEEMEAEYTTDLIKKMQLRAKDFERRRVEEKEPFLRQGQFVDSFFTEYKDKLQAAIDKAAGPLARWLTKKKEAEQAARDADAKLLQEMQASATQTLIAIPEEAPEEQKAQAIQHLVDTSQASRTAQAIAATPISVTATGKSGSKGALKTVWVGTIQDTQQLDLHKLRPYITVKALEEALARFVKQGGRQCDGAEIKEVTDVKVK